MEEKKFEFILVPQKSGNIAIFPKTVPGAPISNPKKNFPTFNNREDALRHFQSDPLFKGCVLLDGNGKILIER